MSVEGCLGGSVLCVCVCGVQNTAGTESHYSKALQTKILCPQTNSYALKDIYKNCESLVSLFSE